MKLGLAAIIGSAVFVGSLTATYASAQVVDPPPFNLPPGPPCDVPPGPPNGLSPGPPNGCGGAVPIPETLLLFGGSLGEFIGWQWMVGRHRKDNRSADNQSTP